MVKLSRYTLVLTAILALSAALPALYWIVMEKPVPAPFVRYSCTEKNYMILRAGTNTVRQDASGRTYSREEFEKRLPMMYYMQLATSGTLPDSINGVAMEVHTLRRASSTYRFQPKYMDSPQPGLYPLFESESGRVNLEMPDDFFRIQERIEFVDAKTNRVNEKKSALFTDELQRKGFSFPARIIAGIPTTKKSIDEGYLVTDANNQLFHLKMEKGEPYVKKVSLPENLQFRWIECVDFANRIFYAYLVSTTNDVYILYQDTYKLLQLPVNGFIPEKDELKIYGDLFNYNVIVEGDGYLKTVTLDNNFNKISEYSEKWDNRYQRKEGKIFRSLFPFEMSLKSNTSRYLDFRFNPAEGVSWVILSLLLTLGQLFLIRRKGHAIKNNLADLLVVMMTGIFGFLAVNIFPNKEYR